MSGINEQFFGLNVKKPSDGSDASSLETILRPTTSFSASTALEIIDLEPYIDNYEIEIRLRAETDSTPFNVDIQDSADNGTTWLAGTNYSYNIQRIARNTTGWIDQQASLQATLNLTGQAFSSINLNLSRLTRASDHLFGNWMVEYFANNDGSYGLGFGGTGTSGINAVRVNTTLAMTGAYEIIGVPKIYK